MIPVDTKKRRNSGTLGDYYGQILPRKMGHLIHLTILDKALEVESQGLISPLSLTIILRVIGRQRSYQNSQE